MHLTIARGAALDVLEGPISLNLLEELERLGRIPQVGRVHELVDRHRARVGARLAPHHVNERGQFVILRGEEEGMREAVREQRLGVEVGALLAVQQDHIGHVERGQKLVLVNLLTLKLHVERLGRLHAADGGRVLGVRGRLDELEQALSEVIDRHARGCHRELLPAGRRGELTLVAPLTHIGKRCVPRAGEGVRSVNLRPLLVCELGFGSCLSFHGADIGLGLIRYRHGLVLLDNGCFFVRRRCALVCHALPLCIHTFCVGLDSVSTV